MVRWTDAETEFLRINYPTRGLMYCAEQLGKRPTQIRDKASRMGVKQDKNSDFAKSWQARAAQSKVGKKRPEQAEVMRRLRSSGRLEATPEQRKAISERMKIQIKENGHPRGSLGMKHSPETKAVLSEKSRRRWELMTEEERDAYSKRAAINGLKTSPINREGSSWKAGWRNTGAVRKYFRSRWEANYARYLQWLKDHGQIKEWEHEPETFWFDGIKRGCMSYLPDFRVTENDGRIVYHEVKGWMDDRSKTKIKRMAKYHPAVRLIVIDSKGYRSIAKKIAHLIAGWEK